MWLEVRYKPTTFFSMKLSSATNSAAKSLPCPSPYAVKMALLNSIITFESVETAMNYFPMIRDMDMRFSLPYRWIVNNCLIGIMKQKRHDISKDEKSLLKAKGFSDKDIGLIKKERERNDPFQSVVAFREYVYLSDTLKIAVKLPLSQDLFREVNAKLVESWFFRINYFGKRGCFFQYEGCNELIELSNDFSSILGSEALAPGIMFPLDDVSRDADFKNMNNYDYSTKDAKRVKRIHIFPYRQISANKNYTCYERIGPQ